MNPFSKISFEKVILGCTLAAVFIILPGTMLLWHGRLPSAQSTIPDVSPAMTDIAAAPPQLPDNAGPPPIAVGTRAADFDSTTVDGKSFLFDSQSSHIKIVEFWATWCGPCHMSIPSMEQLDKTLRSSGVQTVGVSLDTDTANQVLPFTKAMGIHYTILVDPQKNPFAASIYNAQALPSVYIIDGKGIIRWSFSGYWQDEEPYILNVVKEIQSGQPVAQS